jgi:hypothetical protein
MTDKETSKIRSVPFPGKISKFINRYRKNGISEKDCLDCSSVCCSHASYAILDNVLRIYELYQKEGLIREDYEFPTGLVFSEFVSKYFDVLFFHKDGLLGRKENTFFYMKSLSSDNHLISIPDLHASWYHDTRFALFSQNKWLNKGCIFLSKKVPEWPEDDKDSSRHCILHNAESNTQITAKPIGCVFHTCKEPRKMKVPSRKQSHQFDELLAQYYPNSIERFLKLVDEKEHKSYLREKKIFGIGRLLAVLSILLWWVPFLGLLVSIFAVLINSRRKGLIALFSVIGLIFSIIFTSVAIIYIR